LEPLAGYLTLAEHLWQRPTLTGAYNFGPGTYDAVAVRDVVELARAAYGEGEVHYGTGGEGPHEAAWLALDASKAEAVLGVAPRLTLVQAIKRTMAWYRAHATGKEARQLCESDISDFEALAGQAAGADSNSARIKYG
jgi:CDP-glucose 4,6-dehydratase